MLGDLETNIWRNHAYKISYIRKKRKMNITERRRNGDWMALNGHWNVPAIQSTEWCLKGDWMAPFSFHGMVAFRLVKLIWTNVPVGKIGPDVRWLVEHYFHYRKPTVIGYKRYLGTYVQLLRITDHWEIVCQLDKAMGVDLGDTYLNNKAAMNFTKAIADSGRRKTVKSVALGSYLRWMDQLT